MNTLMVWAFSGLLSLFPACNTTAEAVGATQTQVSGTLTGVEADSIRLFMIDGVSFRKMQAHPLTMAEGNASFDFKTGKLQEGFYFLGIKPQDSKMIILGVDKKIEISGEGNKIKGAKVTGSEINDEFLIVDKQIKAFDKRFMNNIQAYRKAMQTKQGLDEVTQKMADLDKEKVAFHDSLQKANKLLGTVAGVQTYVSYQGFTLLQPEEVSKYKAEPDYFADNFFQFLDFDDAVLNGYPILHERFKAYTNTLGRIIQPMQTQRDYVNKLMDKFPQGSSAHKLALLGATYGFQQSNTGNFVHFGEQYLNNFPEDQQGVLNPLKASINQVRSRVPGAEAPQISLPTPDGDTLSLTDLRGKVVLIDFWASWCGPCRRENPNVVKVYNKYKEQGFEILSVSLDKDRNRWLQAIDQDGLTWHHVSDLKYWKSVAAKTYGVSSIPYTVLIDREGKIIANKLRGASLEAKLAEIFGG